MPASKIKQQFMTAASYTTVSRLQVTFYCDFRPIRNKVLNLHFKFSLD